MSSYREVCLEEYEEVCQHCDAEELVAVHHIDGDQSNNVVENLIPLCNSCHAKVHAPFAEIPPFLDKLRNRLPDASKHDGRCGGNGPRTKLLRLSDEEHQRLTEYRMEEYGTDKLPFGVVIRDLIDNACDNND